MFSSLALKESCATARTPLLWGTCCRGVVALWVLITHGRTNSVEVTVPTEVLAPPHLLFQPLTRSNPAYYEIVGPEIYRVGLLPNSKLSIPKRSVIVKKEDLKFFQYIVMGNASELPGLAAPYDEEETRQIMHLEALANSIDFFDFWRNNANSDQIGNRTAEVRLLNPAT